MDPHLAEEAEALVEDKNFIKDGRKSFYGSLLGIAGIQIAPLIIVFILTFLLGLYLQITNPAMNDAQVSNAISQLEFDVPFDMFIYILSYLYVFLIMLYMIRGDIFLNFFKGLLTKKNIKTIIFSFIVMFLFSMIYNYLMVYVFKLIPDSNNTNQTEVESLVAAFPFLSFIYVVILAVVVEEITYRYFLFGGVKRKNKFLAYIVSMFVFGGMHMLASFGANFNLVEELILIVPYIFSGLVLTYAYDKSRKLGVSISVHFINNLVAYLIAIATLS